MSLLTTATLVVTPNANKTSKLYSVIPSNGNGDFTVTRATTATRVNSAGLIESVGNNIPRLDYSLGSCPNILLEPQRTNLHLKSEQISTWTSKTNVTTTANYNISPTGIQNGTRLQFTANGFMFDASFSQVNATTYTISAWAKRNDSGTQSFGFFVNGSGVIDSVITLTSEWKRFTYTYTSSTTSRVGFAGLSGADVSVFGFQVEAGAYATSYIPTTSASVTRNADSISLGNVYTNGLISASGGTWFLELRNNIARVRDTTSRYGLGDTISTTNNSFSFFHSSASSRIILNKFVAGTPTTLYTTLTDIVKMGIKWNGTTADVFVNGVKVVSATAFPTTVMEYLNMLGSDNPKNINQMALWATPLTDTQLTQLTTL